MPSRLLMKIKNPICVFGIGYNQLKSQGFLPKCAQRNLKVLQSLSVGFSVRNDGSMEQMQQYGFQLDQVPDPGFFLDGDYQRPNPRSYAIIQMAGDSLNERMPNGEAWLKNIAKCADWLMNRGLYIVFIPHCEMDVDVIKRSLRHLTGSDYEILDFYDGITDEGCQRILSYYKFADFVIASRGHSQIISYGMKTPFVTFSTHYKQRVLSRRLGFDEYVTSSPKDFLTVCIKAFNERQHITDAEAKGMIDFERQVNEYLDDVVDKVLVNDKGYSGYSLCSRLLGALEYRV